MVQCVSCLAQYPDGKEYCPACGSPTRIYKSQKMARCIALFGAILALSVVFAFIASWNPGTEHSEKPERTVAPENKILAIEIGLRFSQNQINAENRFRNQLVHVTGRITEIARDRGGNAYVVLDDAVQAFVTPDEVSTLIAASKGRLLSATCDVGGKPLFYVHLTGCKWISLSVGK